jgi:hypothetical protein
MKRFFLVLPLISVVLCFAQAPLTNDSIVKMSKAGLSETVILNAIKSQPGFFSSSADDLIALKGAGVTDKVIEAMMAKGKPPAKTPAKAPAKSAATAAPNVEAAPNSIKDIHEVGVYYLARDGWTDLTPEIINWKTTGILKTIGTVGLVKEDRSGHVNAAHSRTALRFPVSLLVYTPEGVDVAEYRLLRLRVVKDIREFRTGDDGGRSAGDLVSFQGKKLADRTYQINLGEPNPGEYGLMPPGQVEKVTKLYTFRLQ